MTEQMCDQCYPEWREWLTYRGARTVQLQQIGPPNAGMMITEIDGTHVTSRRRDIRNTIIRQQDLIVRLCQSTPRPHRWVAGDRSRRIVEVPA